MRIKDLDSTGNLFQILSLYLFLNKLQLSARIPPNKYINMNVCCFCLFLFITKLFQTKHFYACSSRELLLKQMLESYGFQV